MLVYLAGMVSDKKGRPFVETYKLFGYFVSFAALYTLSFRSVLQYWQEASNPAFLTFGLGTAAGMLLGVGWAVQAGYFKDRISALELSALAALLVASLMLLLSPGNVSVNTVVVNAALVALALITIVLGFEMRNPFVFNLGVVLFVLFIITRYVDVGWRLKDKSLFFVGGGFIIMILGVLLEKQRRKIIERMKEK